MLDVTSLLTYVYCPRKLFLEKALFLEKPSKPELLIGAIKHTFFQYIVNALQELVLQIQETTVIKDLLRAHYYNLLDTILKRYAVDSKAQALDEVKLHQELVEILTMQVSFFTDLIEENIHQHHCYGQALWDTFNPRFRTEVYLASKQLQLKGKIDVLLQTPDLAVPIELKFSHAPILYQGHHIQVAAYIMLLQDAGYPSGYGTVYFPQLNVKENISLNPFLKYDIERLVAKIHALISENSLPSYCNNKAKCNGCEYRIRCYDEVFMAEKIKTLQTKDLNTT
ncbi:CRISPR-associated protein Cas4 [Candidatus Woesearchaeota archaeon]|nr:CRISPR-associated protein Cas4 [Candidatus Woesearchaeota archaeon]